MASIEKRRSRTGSIVTWRDGGTRDGNPALTARLD